jgi:hypothetical protein
MHTTSGSELEIE